MGGVSISMAGRLDRAENKAGIAVDAVSSSVRHAVAARRPLGMSADSSTFVELADPEVRTLFLATNECPAATARHGVSALARE